MQVLDAIDDARLDELNARGEFFWLDIPGATPDQLRALADRFGWHPLALEDMVEAGQRPKLDRYDDQMLLVFYGVGAGRTGSEHPGLIEVHLMVSGNWVITVRPDTCPELDRLRARLARNNGQSEQYVVYAILDTLTDTFFPVLERIDEAIDTLEDEIIESPSDAQLQRLFRLKRALLALRRVVTPQRDLAARAINEIEDLPGLIVGTRDYFRDVYDHLIRVSDMVDSYRDLLSGAMDVYLSVTSNRLNMVMKRLTLVATIFLPVMALTGFFGMNFGWLVGRINGLAAFLIVGVGSIALSCALLMAWFMRARFLE